MYRLLRDELLSTFFVDSFAIKNREFDTSLA